METPDVKTVAVKYGIPAVAGVLGYLGGQKIASKYGKNKMLGGVIGLTVAAVATYYAMPVMGFSNFESNKDADLGISGRLATIIKITEPSTEGKWRDECKSWEKPAGIGATSGQYWCVKKTSAA